MSYADYNATKVGQNPNRDSETRKAKWAPYLAEIARQLNADGRSLKSEYAANRAGFRFC